MNKVIAVLMAMFLCDVDVYGANVHRAIRLENFPES